MSAVKCRYWIAPEKLTREQREARLWLHSDMVRHVAGGADGRMTLAAIREYVEGGDGSRLREMEDLYASELPGRWVVLSESWQGRERDHLFMRSLYVERENDVVCIVSGDYSLGGRCEVDTIWLSVAEAEAIGAEVRS